ncbi:MAG: galactokinase [Treponema sp.]|jgi:galactokinase|nr:galactokinase [Treponema sp.]
MNIKELLIKIDSKRAAEIFSWLYGSSEVEAARRRYKSLITEISKSGTDKFSENENLRMFSAPGRTELAGNHTDHNRGKVLAASIHLDNVAVVQKRNDNTVFFRSTNFPDEKVKLTDTSGAPDLKPKPEERGTTSAIIRGIAAGTGVTGGFSANAESGVLPGSGLSSSAALEMLLCRVFDSLYGDGKRSPLEIAQIGKTAENVYFGKPCGLMDQIICATGGAAAIDFFNEVHPEIKPISFDLAACGYTLCVVNTGGSHANLTVDYASIPAEMNATAALFGKSVLGELEKETILYRASEVRKTLGDRALLRSLHFFDENERVDTMTFALVEMESAATNTKKQQALKLYLDMVNESGNSSWELLQNTYPPSHHETQAISAALALTKNFFRSHKLQGACRVHGGGFAGTIQAYIPSNMLNVYRSYIEEVFGAGSVTELIIRPAGVVELDFGE